MPRFSIVTAALTLLPLLSTSAFGAGCHFRATLGDRQIELFGTRHVLPQLPAFEPASLLQGQDVLALEVANGDGNQPGTLSVLWNSLSLFARDLPITAAQQAKLDRLLKRHEIPKGLANRLQPLVLSILLEQKARDPLGIKAEYGAEPLLTEAARALKIPVHSLESGYELMRQIQEMPEADQLKLLLKAVNGIDDGSFVKTEAAEIDRWVRCDVNGFEQEEAEAQTTGLQTLLGNHPGGRTPKMAEHIEALSQQHPKVFAAVGALHLFGDQGLIEQFKRRGYEISDVSARPEAVQATPTSVTESAAVAGAAR